MYGIENILIIHYSLIYGFKPMAIHGNFLILHY